MMKPKIAELLDHLTAAAGSGDVALPAGVASLAQEWAEFLSDGLAAQGAPVEASAGDIAAYVDGQLAGAELEAFEAKLVASPSLRDEVADLLERKAELELRLAPPPPASAVSEEGLRATLASGRPLSLDQQRALFTDRALRARYNHMIREEKLRAPVAWSENRGSERSLQMPARIAASSDKVVNDRTFPGGASHIGPAGRPNLLQIRIQLTGDAFSFDTLELRGSDGALAYLDLPEPNPDREIIRVVDLNDPSDAEAIRLLRDPLTVGEFRSMR